jgi:hypothetical protein
MTCIEGNVFFFFFKELLKLNQYAYLLSFKQFFSENLFS